MTYREANEQGLDVLSYEWDSLRDTFGINVLIEVAKSAYGDKIYVDDDDDPDLHLYHLLWSYHYLDNFTHPWYFIAHFYNRFKYEPDMDDVLVTVKTETA